MGPPARRILGAAAGGPAAQALPLPPLQVPAAASALNWAPANPWRDVHPILILPSQGITQVND